MEDAEKERKSEGEGKCVKSLLDKLISDAEEYGMEEGTEGWMMVKKEEENGAVRLSVLLVVLILFF